MSTYINDLTPGEFTNLLDEYFAPPAKRSKMTEEEIKDLAVRLNDKIDVPFIREAREERILIKIVIKIDRFMYDNLPNELYDLVRSIDRGIDDEEAKRLIKRLSKLANKHIDIAYIPEQMEYIAIRFIIGIVINAARNAWDLNRAKNELSNRDDIPDTLEANDSDLENLILA